MADRIEANVRALAQGEPGEAVARILHWNGPKHMDVPHGGICARTFAEFPKGAGENGGYWKEGAPLYLSPTASAPAAEREPMTEEKAYQGWKESTVGRGSLGGRMDAFMEGVRFAEKCHGIGTKEPAP